MTWFKWINQIKSSWKVDIVAGISVALLSIPQSIAYANLLNLPIETGLYAASIPTIVAAIFGSSRFLSTGPVAITSLVTLSTVSVLSAHSTQDYQSLIVSLTLTAGLIQILFGIFKIANLINLVAHPIITGFTSAAAIIISVTQLNHLLGLPNPQAKDLISNIIYFSHQLPQLDPSATLLGIGSIIGIIGLKRLNPKAPSVLIMTLIATLLSRYLEYGGPIVGYIHLTPPHLFIPQFNIPISPLLSSAFIIAIISYMESISIAKKLANTHHDEINPNQEIIAQGIAKLSSGLIGSFPVSGSFARSALNYNAGARSNLSSITTGLFTLIIVSLLTPWLYYLPQATLAAIVITAVYQLVDTQQINYLVKNRRRDGIIALVTFFACLLYAPNLVNGILVGIGASVFMHLHRSFKPHIDLFWCNDTRYLTSHYYHLKSYPSNKYVLAVTLDWSLTFANATYLRSEIMAKIRKHSNKPKYVLILCRGINFIDASAEDELYDFFNELQSMQITLLFSGIKTYLAEKITHTHLNDVIQQSNMFDKANQALEWIYKKETKQKL